MVHFDTTATATKNLKTKKTVKDSKNGLPTHVSKKNKKFHHFCDEPFLLKVAFKKWFTNQSLPTRFVKKSHHFCWNLGLRRWKITTYNITSIFWFHGPKPWCCKGRSSKDRPSASMIPQISPESSESDPEASLIIQPGECHRGAVEARLGKGGRCGIDVEWSGF